MLARLMLTLRFKLHASHRYWILYKTVGSNNLADKDTELLFGKHDAEHHWGVNLRIAWEPSLSFKLCDWHRWELVLKTLETLKAWQKVANCWCNSKRLNGFTHRWLSEFINGEFPIPIWRLLAWPMAKMHKIKIQKQVRDLTVFRPNDCQLNLGYNNPKLQQPTAHIIYFALNSDKFHYF